MFDVWNTHSTYLRSLHLLSQYGMLLYQWNIIILLHQVADVNHPLGVHVVGPYDNFLHTRLDAYFR